MIRLLRSKKGVSLIEIVVGMLLFAIIATSVTAVFIPMMRISERANDLAECSSMLDKLANHMINDISMATTELDGPSGPNVVNIIAGAEVISYTVGTAGDNSGALLRNGSIVFDKSFYKRKNVNFSCKPVELDTGDIIDSAYRLTIIISSDKGNEMMRREYAVKPLVLHQKWF